MLVAGDTVGHYTVVEQIGAGGFGEVYRARHEKIGREVAIKVLHERFSSDAAAGARFVAEARAVNTIGHRGIVEIFDFGTRPDGRAYFVMELLRGETLASRLREGGAMELAEAVPVLRGIAEAIDAAHAAGIAHRDLKPDNVFLLSDGAVKVIDFGLAKLVENPGAGLTESGLIMGSPRYMAPEQFRGRDVGPASDAYAFGALVFHMLVGEPPFDARDALALGLQHLNDTPPVPSARRPGLGPTVDRVVGALLAKNPADRPTTLATAVTMLAEQAPAGAAGIVDNVPRPPAGRTRRAGRRAGARLVLGLALFAAGAAVAMVAWRSTRVAAGPRPSPAIRVVVDVAPGTSTELAPPVARMVSAALAGRDARAYAVLDPGPAGAGLPADEVHIAFGLHDDEVSLDATRGAHAVAHAVGPSVSEALDTLIPVLGPALDAGRPPAPASPEEQAGMVAVGAPSVVAYRRYEHLRDAWDRSWYTDPVPLVPALERLVAEEPTWAHPYALLTFLLGPGSVPARALYARSVLLLDRARDPIGTLILEALEASSDAPRAIAIFESDPRTRDDLLAAQLLGAMYVYVNRADDAVAVLRAIHVRRPDLQYGYNLQFVLRSAGRDEESYTEMQRWAALRPEAEHPLVDLARMEALRGRIDEGRRLLARRRVLIGERPNALGVLIEAYLALGDLVSAHRGIDQELGAAGMVRARGRYYAGVLAIVEGRFGAAEDTLRLAYPENVAAGQTGRSTQVVATLRGLAMAFGDRASQVAALDRAIEVGRSLTQLGTAALEYERDALARPETCPPLDARLASIPDAVMRSTVRRRMLRVAARLSCVPCTEVVAAGSSADEPSPASLNDFARCAEEVGDLALARRSYERAMDMTSFQLDASAYDSLLAEFHLARVSAALGDRAGAKQHYTRFVERWEHADRPVPEVRRAQEALRAL